MKKLGYWFTSFCLIAGFINGCGTNHGALTDKNPNIKPNMNTVLGSMTVAATPNSSGQLSCPYPEPHYKIINGTCVPSCGVALNNQPGTMLAVQCSAGYTYAGLSWEEISYGSKCCIDNRSIPPLPTPTPVSNPPATVPGGTTPTAACPFSIPPLSRMNVAIHNNPFPGKFIIDSTPIVCSMPGTPFENYCQNMMQDPLRGCCPVRPEGDPTRPACEAVAVGRDPSDGVYGPHFTYSGPGNNYRNENPYLYVLVGASGGTIRACSNTQPQVCGERVVPQQ